MGSVSTWIFTIARNRLIDHVRREQVRQGDLSDPAKPPEPIPMTDDLIDRRRRYMTLKAAVEALPEEQADMLPMGRQGPSTVRSAPRAGVALT